MPTSSFMQHFLQSFGLQMHHVGVKFILYVACFVMLCEAYLVIRPFPSFFPHFFYFHSQKRGTMDYSCGRAVVYRKNGPPLPRMKFTESFKKWQRTFFYVRDIREGRTSDAIELPDAEVSALETEQVVSLITEHAATAWLKRERHAKAKAMPTVPTGTDSPSTEATRDAMTSPPSEAPDARSSPAPADAHLEPPPEVMVLPASMPSVRPKAADSSGSWTFSLSSMMGVWEQLHSAPPKTDKGPLASGQAVSTPRVTGVMARYKKNEVSFDRSVMANLKTVEKVLEADVALRKKEIGFRSHELNSHAVLDTYFPELGKNSVPVQEDDYGVPIVDGEEEVASSSDEPADDEGAAKTAADSADESSVQEEQPPVGATEVSSVGDLGAPPTGGGGG
ncbi:hypothetical protein D1007_04285 [Hordeum vulgare]|nr:hypothetical protein D1007_04285 [Hordeum vulgare]